MPNILIVSPRDAAVNPLPEIAALASGARVTLLDGAVGIREVERVLRDTQFDVVHLAQHGAYGLLQLSDGLVTQERMTRCLQHQEHLAVVVINACNSAGTAALIHNAVGCAVIAHEAPIGEQAAQVFAREFYAALLDKQPIYVAYRDACAALVRTLPDSVQPVLINGAMSDMRSLQAEMAGLIEAFRMLRGEVSNMRHSLRLWFAGYGVLFALCVVVLALQFHV